MGNLVEHHFIKVKNLNDFFIWFRTGFEHITDLSGFDHILYLFALCSIYTPKQWKGLLVLITAFTVGHSLTLALSVLGLIHFNVSLIEFLIPLTILFTCISNLYYRNDALTGNFRMNYLLTAGFGLIHGLGFSTLLRSLLGSAGKILSPLFAFNIGLEAGQLIIVAFIMVFSLALTGLLHLKRTNLNLIVSSIAGLIALIMAVERFVELMR
jgi:hypothetical protein